jgi:hypothetical protein
MTSTEFGKVRHKRHEIRYQLGEASVNMSGEAGIDKEHQLLHVDAAIKAVRKAATALEELRTMVADRDWAAYIVAKDRYRKNQVDLNKDDDDDDDDDTDFDVEDAAAADADEVG